MKKEEIKKLKGKDRAKALCDIATTLLDGEKAEDVVVIDLEDKTDIAYFMVVASGFVARHTKALGEKLAYEYKHHGVPVQVEGFEVGEWILVDAGEVMVHIFQPEVRARYSIEQLWEPGVRKQNNE